FDDPRVSREPPIRYLPRRQPRREIALHRPQPAERLAANRVLLPTEWLVRAAAFPRVPRGSSGPGPTALRTTALEAARPGRGSPACAAHFSALGESLPGQQSALRLSQD